MQGSVRNPYRFRYTPFFCYRVKTSFYRQSVCYINTHGQQIIKMKNSCRNHCLLVRGTSQISAFYLIFSRLAINITAVTGIEIQIFHYLIPPSVFQTGIDERNIIVKPIFSLFSVNEPSEASRILALSMFPVINRRRNINRANSSRGKHSNRNRLRSEVMHIDDTMTLLVKYDAL